MQITEKDNQKLDTEWNSTAKQYYLILSETSPEQANELNRRIVRDNDNEILDLLNSAKDYEDGLAEVEFFLKTNKIQDWVWKEAHLDALIRREFISDDLPRFPNEEWTLEIGEPTEYLEWMRGILDSSPTGSETPSKDKISNLSRIAPTRDFLIALLEREGDLMDAKPLIADWIGKYFENELDGFLMNKRLDAKTPEQSQSIQSIQMDYNSAKNERRYAEYKTDILLLLMILFV